MSVRRLPLINDVLEIKDLIKHFESGATGEIVKTQTTYLDAVCSFRSESCSPQKFRVHFRGKREFLLGKGGFTRLRLLDKHPLLLDYTEPHIAVQLISTVNEKQLFREELALAADKIFDGWRSVEDYNFMPLDEFLEGSYGILMVAPKPFAEAVMQAAERSGVKLRVSEEYPSKGNVPLVLLLDEWCVVADDFKVERVD